MPQQTFLDKVLIMLRHHREAAGFSQSELAEKLKIGLRSYQRYESGETLPTIDIFFNISRILGFELNDFFAPHMVKNSLPGLKLFESDTEDVFFTEPEVKQSPLLEIYQSPEFKEALQSKDWKLIAQLPLFKNASVPLAIIGVKQSLFNQVAVKLTGLHTHQSPTGSWLEDKRKVGIIWAILMDHKKTFFTYESESVWPNGRGQVKSHNIFINAERTYLILSTFTVQWPAKDQLIHS